MGAYVSTYCGLVCETCEYRESMNCGGCIATKGNPFHVKCPVSECCISKGKMHCGKCADFPCALLNQYSCDPVHGDHPPGARIEHLKKLEREDG